MKVIDLEQLVVLSAEAWDADACSVAVLNDYLENLKLRSRIAQQHIFFHSHKSLLIVKPFRELLISGFRSLVE